MGMAYIIRLTIQGMRRYKVFEYAIKHIWPILLVWWVLEYVLAVKNVIIWDKKVVTTKTIGTGQDLLRA